MRSISVRGGARFVVTSVLACVCAIGSTGCLSKMILNGQIKATRTGSGAADTIADYELARAAASAGLLQFEGMHKLAPDNEDGLFLLLRSWTGYGYAFPQDDFEAAALAGDDDAAEYHKKRAQRAFERAIGYGLELLAMKDGGFEAARKNADTMNAWLGANFTDESDAETLLWLGSAWAARVNVSKDDPSIVGDLFIGVAMLERSRALAPSLNAWAATSALGAYHARTAMAELDESKKLLELALAKTERKSFGVQLNYARYACVKGDRELYEKLLNEIVSTEDPDPNFRLVNTVARRRARRGLTKAALEDCNFHASLPTSAPPPEPAPPTPKPEAPTEPTKAAPTAPAPASKNPTPY